MYTNQVNVIWPDSNNFNVLHCTCVEKSPVNLHLVKLQSALSAFLWVSIMIYLEINHNTEQTEICSNFWDRKAKLIKVYSEGIETRAILPVLLKHFNET